MKLVLSPAAQRWTAIGFAVVAAVAVSAIVILPIARSIAHHYERTALLRKQASKLEALVLARPRLEEVAREVSARPDVRALTIDATQSSAGAGELQAMVNRLFGEAGAVVTSGEPLAGGDGGRVAVRTSLETDIGGLVRALHAIGSARPLLTVESVRVSEPDGEFAAVGPQPAVANKLIVDIVVSARLKGA